MSKVKLSPAMKEVMSLLRDNKNTRNTFYDSTVGCFVAKGVQFNKKTFDALIDRGLINRQNYFPDKMDDVILSELGKTIDL